MSKTYRLGVIGFAHMHVNSLIDRFNELPNVEWVACADTVPDVPSLSMARSTRGYNLKRAHKEIGIPKVYDDYRAMLDKEGFDIIIFCPENARHPDVAEAIAGRGIHMVTEKPMAASLSGALRMVRAAEANSVELVVNWPSTWQSAIRTMKKLIDSGVVGDVWEFKWRNGASMGPLGYGQNITDQEKGAEWWHQAAPGGGALLDYCCYGACLSRWMLGQPAVAVYGIKANMTSHYGDADDNAVLTVRFPKALAILEGTWTTWSAGVPTGPVIYGSRGTLVANRRIGEDGVARSVVEVYTSRHGHGPDQVLEGDPLPEGRTTLAEEVIHHLETGDPLHPTLEMRNNLEMMAILDAGIRSAASGKQELVNDMTWCIG
ncbi:MAG: Gfo/Idh/MocA family oxidoreductase [Anaerolineales bacterium]|nr:MAG: Gfo/Idh/MocA family oxidoreductase [Anaerolineales bacterium]